MLVLYVGGSASGKSEAAEQAALRLATEERRPLIYLATMQGGGEEAAARIARHRAQRAGRGFLTVECPHAIHTLALPDGAVVLLEDLGNLVGNVLFSKEAEKQAEENVLALLKKRIFCLEARCRALFLVGALLAEEAPYSRETERYVRLFSALQNALAARAEEIVFVELGRERTVERRNIG